MLKDCADPVQPFAIGVAVTVAIPGAVVLKLILPIPLPVKPMPVLLFVQLMVAVGKTVKLTATGSPTQTVTSAGSVNTGFGLTVTVKDFGWPLQPIKVGVTVMVATTGAVPGFTVEKLMLPVPFAASPMEGLEFVQL